MASEETLEAAPPQGRVEDGDSGSWKTSMVGVMRQVLMELPEKTTLGEIVEATRANPQMASCARRDVDQAAHRHRGRASPPRA